MMMLSKREQNAGAVISMLAVGLLLTYIGFSVVGFKSESSMLTMIGAVLLSSLLLCLVVLIRYRRAGKPLMIDYFNIGTQRFILGLMMVMYGIDKLLGNFFDYQLFALDSRLADVSEFQLAWFFYGKNPWQELLAGILEFVPGVLLFYRRTYYVAALVLLPVCGQVFLLNFFFKIGGVTFPAATILLACNIYIIYSQRAQIMQFFRSLNFELVTIPAGAARSFIRVLKGIGIGLACLVVFAKMRPVFAQSPLQRQYKTLVGVYRLKELKRNGLAQNPASGGTCYKDLYIEKQSRWNILRRCDGQTDAFVLHLDANNDSIGIYINKGGLGDAPDIIDSTTALKGIYHLAGKRLTISGGQQQDTLELVYERQDDLQPKKWLW